MLGIQRCSGLGFLEDPARQVHWAECRSLWVPVYVVHLQDPFMGVRSFQGILPATASPSRTRQQFWVLKPDHHLPPTTSAYLVYKRGAQETIMQLSDYTIGTLSLSTSTSPEMQTSQTLDQEPNSRPELALIPLQGLALETTAASPPVMV